jgi:UDP-N-acetylmuramoylalanine--D-glutamate ligase
MLKRSKVYDMKTPSWYPVAGKTYVVLGLARSGFSTVKWLLQNGARVIAIDDNASKVEEAVRLGASRASSSIPWSQVAALVQSPGVPLWFPVPHPVTLEARAHNVPIIGDGDIFRLSHPDARFIGITGTNGKSTTTALVGHILRSCGVDCQIGGNIGTPMLDLPNAQVYVLELSSYQLDLSHSLDLYVAVWLNISPDHLDRHGSMENYGAAKKRIFKTNQEQQIAIIGVDDALSESVWREISAHQTTVPVSIKRSFEQGIFVEAEWLMDGGERVLDVTLLSNLKGAHNYQNVAIAYGVCKSMGLDKVDIAHAIGTFPGLAHRQEWVRTINGISFVNDSKGTNADATAKALAVYDKIYWIAGGQAKGDGIDSLASYFAKIVHTYLIGDAQAQFANTLEAKVPYTKCGTIDKAVREAYHMAVTDGFSNPVVLLSPACASWDQFEDFEHRGRTFCQLVQSLES